MIAKFSRTATVVLFASITLQTSWGQLPPVAAPAGQPGGRGAANRAPGGLGGVYNPRPPADPAQLERGKGLYGVQCTFCHGVDARGGEGGPNLLRSQIVLSDMKGELLTPVLQNGLPDRGMPKINVNPAQAADIAAFLHSLNTGNRDPSRNTPPTIVTGNATAGDAYFRKVCAGCHSVSGDLKGIATKYSDPRNLQQSFVMPGGGGRGVSTASPKTVTVTLPSGEKLEGKLDRIDDFIVAVAGSDGSSRTFTRKGAIPKVEVHDPLAPHKKLLPVYTDKDIHDLTAYLVTIK